MRRDPFAEFDPVWLADYQRRNRLAYEGKQAHDYCHGTHCISCGCSDRGPCVSHRPLKPPVFR